MSALHYISSWAEFSDTIHSHADVVLCSYSPRCYFSVTMAPVFKTVAADLQLEGPWYFCRVDSSKQTDVAKFIQTTKTPHFVIIRNRNVISERTGHMKKEQLEAWVKSYTPLKETESDDCSSIIDGSSILSDDMEPSAEFGNCPLQFTEKPCTGEMQDRPKHGRWLRGYVEFDDVEPSCAFVPTENDPGLRIGRANVGESFMALTFLSCPAAISQGKLNFKFSFIPDPFEDVRFKSALFSVVVEVEGPDKTLTTTKVLDITAFSGTEDDNTPSPDVKMCGVQTPTAKWALLEQSARDGLSASYMLSATIPPATWVHIKYFAEAKLIKNSPIPLGNSVVLKIGSADAPFERKLGPGTAIQRETEAD